MQTDLFNAEGKFSDPRHALDFMLAGNATVTLRSLKTMTRYTYKITRADKNNPILEPVPTRFFVGLLKGPDNEQDFTYLGMIYRNPGDNPAFRLTRSSRLNADSGPVQALQYTLRRLVSPGGLIPAELEIWHSGRCGRCNRKLTVPESVASGFGPECADKLA